MKSKNRDAKKSFTLVEICVATVILGILTAIAIPSYINYVQQSAAQAAQTNLLAIFGVEKSYYFNNGYYCTTAPANPNCADNLPDINKNLNLSIVDNYYSYACQASGGPPYAYCCQATDLETPSTMYTTCGGSYVCTPNCSGLQCGSDGCGGSCGTCSSGENCNASGQCVCVPNCSGVHCGGDGCGGSCGSCSAGQTCSSGQCFATCTPNCNGRSCGSDGCGGLCGSGCTDGQVCTLGGVCVTCTSSAICGGVSGGGCTGTCNVSPPGCGSCSCFSTGGACGVKACAPDCNNKTCGSGGCGSSCGTCPYKETCSSGKCVS